MDGASASAKTAFASGCRSVMTGAALGTGPADGLTSAAVAPAANDALADHAVTHASKARSIVRCDNQSCRRRQGNKPSRCCAEAGCCHLLRQFPTVDVSFADQP